MRDILLNIRELEDVLTPTEKKISQYILENPEETTTLAISELARICDTSEASIVRFCKTLKLKGFQALKIGIATSLASNRKEIDGGIRLDDTLYDIVQKVGDFNKRAIEQASLVLDLDLLEKAIDAISNGERIYFFGVGASGLVAYDAMLKFMRINIPCFYYSDNHLQLTSAANLTRDDVAVGISYSGDTKEVVEALRIAKDRGANTISITKVGSSHLTKEAHINLFVSSEESVFRTGAMASRIAQLTLIDILFVSVAIKKYPEVINYLKSTSEATSLRKI